LCLRYHVRGRGWDIEEKENWAQLCFTPTARLAPVSVFTFQPYSYSKLFEIHATPYWYSTLSSPFSWNNPRGFSKSRRITISPTVHRYHKWMLFKRRAVMMIDPGYCFIFHFLCFTSLAICKRGSACSRGNHCWRATCHTHNTLHPRSDLQRTHAQ